MTKAKIAAIATHFPPDIVSNDDLAELFPEWTADKILAKTGIAERHISAVDETASDLGMQAALKLFNEFDIDRNSIDFLLLCTQSPDFILPTTACVLQDRLGLRQDIGALDFNLGCSGFVYGLSLAKGLIETGSARRVLLITADTYSKLIHPKDKSVRTIFGDGAAATLIEAQTGNDDAIGPFIFGTNGAGAKDLIVKTGGAREERSPSSAQEYQDDSGNTRTADNLYMDGGAVMAFTLRAVPDLMHRLLEKAALTIDDIDYVVFHQANTFILETLRKKCKIPEEKFVVHMSHCGNTVSSTIPIAMTSLPAGSGSARRVMVVGFGVGLSWAGTIINY
ncbi:3-oxoacyl-ACP synthase III family protein [Pandoraea apista]|uniref:Ketoacyl-ACP synthase III n=1 Tax=Pandoraea apista TaxID=93218 RepID=A0ABX9ZP13_9BURK|nr:ketoacyl-ACP synthase III [Pandoraea apista]PTD99368.1 3-oxoacyl-ACP synthase [Pandoraea apista]RRJ31613.1 ketoacyl-ACP synthase III [Pandoraea apista]RRJ81308.1 ketoacyl-ACP synthase III [Pandoraea apista]RRW96343.1 ketoacyl-ACP synthase III [Pandoraea apista]RRX03535.1 ketoacyl-ACP synthase III [Pandoraea apista]